MRAIAILLAEAYDRVREAGEFIAALDYDAYNEEYRNGAPQAGFKRMLAQISTRRSTTSAGMRTPCTSVR